MKLERWLAKYLGGHITIGPVTIYGHNAMHWAVNIKTRRWGYVCFRLPLPSYGWRPLYFYLSPNATPWAATFMLGRRGHWEDWALSRVRRNRLGHGFHVDDEDVYAELRRINNAV